MISSNYSDGFSHSASGYHFHILVGSRGMVNLVVVLVFCVEMNVVLHVHIMTRISGP